MNKHKRRNGTGNTWYISSILWLVFGISLGYGVASFQWGFKHNYIGHLASSGEAQVRFSPNGQCTELVIATIGRAEKQVLVQAYAFTSLKIASALITAHQRGVNVQILVDRSQLTSRGSQVKNVINHGIHILVDRVPGIAHNKVMIVDDTYILTGSFNWSNAAESKNAENLLLINSPSLNKIYRDNWWKRALKAETIHFKD